MQQPACMHDDAQPTAYSLLPLLLMRRGLRCQACMRYAYLSKSEYDKKTSALNYACFTLDDKIDACKASEVARPSLTQVAWLYDWSKYTPSATPVECPL